MKLSRLPHLALIASSSSPLQGAASCTHPRTSRQQQEQQQEHDHEHPAVWQCSCCRTLLQSIARPQPLAGSCWMQGAKPHVLCQFQPKAPTFSGARLVQKMSWLMWPAAGEGGVVGQNNTQQQVGAQPAKCQNPSRHTHACGSPTRCCRQLPSAHKTHVTRLPALPPAARACAGSACRCATPARVLTAAVEVDGALQGDHLLQVLLGLCLSVLCQGVVQVCHVRAVVLVVVQLHDLAADDRLCDRDSGTRVCACVCASAAEPGETAAGAGIGTTDIPSAE